MILIWKIYLMTDGSILKNDKNNKTEPTDMISLKKNMYY